MEENRFRKVEQVTCTRGGWELAGVQHKADTSFTTYLPGRLTASGSLGGTHTPHLHLNSCDIYLNTVE